MKKIPLIIDTDPGIDDAAAIIAAFNSEELDIKLISTVFGNVDIEKTTNNALKLVEFLNKDVNVAKGAYRSLYFSDIIDASEVHGESGMDGYVFENPKKKIMDKVAVEAIKEVLENSKEKVYIATMGALTNIALLLLIYPNLKDKIAKIIVMGGSLSSGNTNTISEFNIYNDPHSAKLVFDSGLDIVVFGLDVTRKCIITPEKLEILKNYNKTTNMCYSLFKNYRSEGIKKGLIMHDATTIAYLLKPDIFEYEEKYIDVATEGAAIGAFVSDYYTIRNKNKKANVKYAVNVDSKKFENWLIDTLCK